MRMLQRDCERYIINTDDIPPSATHQRDSQKHFRVFLCDCDWVFPFTSRFIATIQCVLRDCLTIWSSSTCGESLCVLIDRDHCHVKLFTHVSCDLCVIFLPWEDKRDSEFSRWESALLTWSNPEDSSFVYDDNQLRRFVWIVDWDSSEGRDN